MKRPEVFSSSLRLLLLHLLFCGFGSDTFRSGNRFFGSVVRVSALSSSSSFSSSMSSSSSSLYGKETRNIATQVLQGTGPPTADLNRYNLPYQTIVGGWTANFVQKATESRSRVKLEATDNANHYVETIALSFPRSDAGSLGIELEELAGGRDDGIGITVVSGLVPGGSAEASDLNPGDALSSVELIRRKKKIETTTTKTKDEASADANAGRIADEEEVFSVATECLDYESTVEAIASAIPPPERVSFEDTFLLTIKRLRRLPKIKVRLEYPPEQKRADEVIELRAGENLRQGMLVKGVALNDPLAKRFDTKSGGNCGAGGLCRTCSVCVMEGGDLLNPQRVAEKQMLADKSRWRLACKAVVGYGMNEGEMVVRVNPNQW